MTEPPWIVREHRREYRKVPPPPSNRIIYPVSKSERGFELYITKDSMDRIMQHCNTYAEKRLEAMGFLIGDVYKWKGSWYTVVKEVVSSDLTATNTSVRFDKRGFQDLFAKLENLEYDYIIVGWYHSHPGLGCFLSSKDIETQRRMFNSPFHSALVVDTINQEMEAYKLKREGYAKRGYAIYLPGKELPGK